MDFLPYLLPVALFALAFGYLGFVSFGHAIVCRRSE
jgi:hypothetical protein